MNILFTIFALLGGVAVAIQAQINGGVGKKVGVLEASFISFSIGTIALAFIVLFFGKGHFSAITTVPKWQLIGGLLGAIYIVVAILVVPKIGVLSTFVAVVSGQILMGAFISHFGLFGGHPIQIDMKKILAIILLFISLYLFHQE